MKYLSPPVALIFLFLFQSCAWINKTTDKLTGRKRKAIRKQSVVSKTQYDELARKYDRLKNKYEGGAKSEVVANHSASNELLDDLNDLTPEKKVANKSVIETVDVFGSEGLVKKNNKAMIKKSASITKAPIIPGKSLSINETNQEVGKFQQGSLYLAQGKHDLALRVFQELERSPLLQVRVRAMYKIGELLLKQNEYDLAMQVFENIAENYAFSGVILDTLRGLVICSEKLNLVGKRDRYKSMLTDVFGA
jgi:TolA-binding protein